MAFKSTKQIEFSIRGRIGKAGAPDLLGVNGIYQMRTTPKGKRCVKMKFYVPTNPESPAQQANREKFASAMQAWGELTLEEKALYNKNAKKRNMFGWGYFIREYFRNN